jgi:hypothetical protein
MPQIIPALYFAPANLHRCELTKPSQTPIGTQFCRSSYRRPDLHPFRFASYNSSKGRRRKGRITDATVALQAVDAGIPDEKPQKNPAAQRLLVFLPNAGLEH